jgi:thiol-disulfide isomerase/thioredoxin
MSTPFRAPRSIVFGLSLLWLSLAALAAGADPAAASKAGSDEAAEWKKLDDAWTAFQELSPDTVTGGGMEAFYKEYFPKAGKLADEFEAFLKAYPASPHADDAWDAWMDLLNGAAHRLPERKAQLERVERELLADPKLDRDRRRTIRTNQLDRTATVAERERLLRSLEREFVKPDYVYRLLNVAQHSDYPHSLELADELLKLTEGWGGSVRDDIVTLKATLARIGKPLDLKFTALDGRAIDLKDYRGKVVLLDFWATWCPPCVGGLPEVEKTAAKLHDQGFEVIGLSYDTERDTLETFLKTNALKWPQFFDVQGQDAPLMKSLGSPGPPAYWLIDRDGMLASVNAREDLEPKVKRLLAGRPGRSTSVR